MSGGLLNPTLSSVDRGEGAGFLRLASVNAYGVRERALTARRPTRLRHTFRVVGAPNVFRFPKTTGELRSGSARRETLDGGDC
jgi:hypothetical protein